MREANFDILSHVRHLELLEGFDPDEMSTFCGSSFVPR